MIDYEDHTVSIRAEQAVLGALLVDNDSIDRCTDLDASHFYREDHRIIFGEIQRQIAAGKRADPMTLLSVLADRVPDCLKYCATMRMSAASAANIGSHAAIVREKADKRALVTIAIEAQELAASHQDSASCVDLVASRLEMLTQRKTTFEPRLIGDTMVDYLTMIQDRMAGLHRPIATGYAHFDELMGGGLERGTLTVAAGRPGMGKTAFGLGIARNVAIAGGVSAILSMEMAAAQINDRNMAAIGGIPLAWLRSPSEEDRDSPYWSRLAYATQKAQTLKMWIDEQAGMNMLELRAKARKIKRKTGLDLLVIDQLSFIQGGDAEQEWQRIGQYTRGLIELAKSLDVAVLLLAQLNRKCEDRTDKRPIMSDLAQSGSIEQDAANIVFLYRDVIYNKETHEPEIAEIISAKQRQGTPGTVGMRYNGAITKFEDLPYRWEKKAPERDPAPNKQRRGFN
jgi:replicative DNA helicase